MKVLNPKLNVNEFFHRLLQARERVQLLDCDGTRAPFKTDPGEALPYPGVRELITRVMESSNTRLVIVTGRWTRGLIPLLGVRNLPEIWGAQCPECFREPASCEELRAIVSPPLRAFRFLTQEHLPPLCSAIQ